MSMSMSVSVSMSVSLSVPRLSLPPKPKTPPRIPSVQTPSYNGKQTTVPLHFSADKTLASSWNLKGNLLSACRWRLHVKKENGESGERENGERGESTMPKRFRHLTKEAPDPPVRWPWFIVPAFLIYAWRAVLFELSNWKKAAIGIVRFMGYLGKLALALIFHFIGDPVTSSIRFVEDVLYGVRAFYSSIVAYAPVHELTVIIILASAVLAIAEGVVPNSVNCQPFVLTLSGLIGYAAVKGYISEPFFWTLLVGIYMFSRIVKRRDDVTSALPAAAVLAAVGEPWVRLLAIVSYTALAIHYHSKNIEKGKELEEVVRGRELPLPLFGVALAIGIRAAAKWAGYRHLTWMIV